MKKDIHPKYEKVMVRCGVAATSLRPVVRSQNCTPKSVPCATPSIRASRSLLMLPGRIDRFNKKYGTSYIDKVRNKKKD